MSNSAWQIVAFYKYVQIENAEAFAAAHLSYCKSIGIGGRIYIADEGINGQLCGTVAQCSRYMQDIVQDERFADIDFKIDHSGKHGFRKIHVRYKNEIVHSGLKGIVDPTSRKSRHLSAEEFKKMKNKPDVVLLDVRSNYETAIGRFSNALTLNMENFREFPDKVAELESLKDKTVITYCTGGIKCEKASLYLEKVGFKDVYQLDGGILKYGKEANGEDFEGRCYVFDERVITDVNTVNPTVISICVHCHQPSARIINCSNDICNDQIVMCDACGWEWEGACCTDCLQSAKRRPYDGSGYYVKKGSVSTVPI